MNVPNSLVNSIINWYHKNSRDLPWRQTKDPYKIWLSEIILQQTRVAQGLPYYYRFIQKFPTVQSLASASEDEVLLLWQGLGYYSRARNLHACAQKIVVDFNGIFPRTYPTLLKLKGVGEYTAAAIASFAFDIREPAIDGNIIRVMSRLFGIFHQPYSPESRKEIKLASIDLINVAPPAIYNQAMMEFGALVCVPKKPDCQNCPVNLFCFAYQNNQVDKLPVSKKKIEIKTRFFHFLIIEHHEKLLLEKRTQNDIWKSLFQFPLIETTEWIDLPQLEHKINALFPYHSIVDVSSVWNHKLTHQAIKAKFIKLKMQKNNEGKPSHTERLQHNNYYFVDFSELQQFAMPQLIRDYLKKIQSII